MLATRRPEPAVPVRCAVDVSAAAAAAVGNISDEVVTRIDLHTTQGRILRRVFG